MNRFLKNMVPQLLGLILASHPTINWGQEKQQPPVPQQARAESRGGLFDLSSPLPPQTEVLVRAEMARLARSRLQRYVNQGPEEEIPILHAADVLVKRLLECLELREQLGQEAPAKQTLTQYALQLQVDKALLAVQQLRDQLGSGSAGPTPMPFMVRLRRQNDLTEALLDLVKCKLVADGKQLADHAEVSQLDADVQALQQKIGMALQDSAVELPRTVDESQRLLDRAKSLIEDAIGQDPAVSSLESIEELLRVSKELLPAGTNGLKNLLIQRLSLLREYRDSLQLHPPYAGNAVNSVTEILETTADVFQAELELCETQAERIACHESFLNFAKHFEKLLNTNQQFTLYDCMQAKLLRLDAEIRLYREREKN